MGTLIIEAIKNGISLIYLFVNQLFGLTADTRRWTCRAVVLNRSNLPEFIRKALKGNVKRYERREYNEIKSRLRIAGKDLIYFANDVVGMADEFNLEIKYFECINRHGINMFHECEQKEYEDRGKVPYQHIETKWTPWFSEDGRYKLVMLYKAFIPLDGRSRLSCNVNDHLGGDFVYVVKDKKPTYLDVNVASITWDDLKRLGFKDTKGVKKIVRRIFRHTCLPNVTNKMIEAGGYVDPSQVAFAHHTHLDGVALMTTKLANQMARTGDRILKGETAMGQMLYTNFHKMMWVFVDKIHGYPNKDILIYGQHFVGKAHVRPWNKGVNVSFWKHGHNFAATVNMGMSSVVEGVGKAILQDLKRQMMNLIADPAQVLLGDSRMPILNMVDKFGVSQEIVRLLTLLRAKTRLTRKFLGIDGTDKRYSWRLSGSGSFHIMAFDPKTMKGLISAKAEKWLKSFEGKSFKELGHTPCVINKDGTIGFTTLEMADRVWHHRFDTADFDDTAHCVKIGEYDKHAFKGVLWRFPVRGNGAIPGLIYDDDPQREWITYPLDIIWGKYASEEDPFEEAPKHNNVVLTDVEVIRDFIKAYESKQIEFKNKTDVDINTLRETLTSYEVDSDKFSFGSWFLVHLAARIIRNHHNRGNIVYKTPSAKALIERLAKHSPSDVLDWSLGLADLPKGTTEKSIIKEMNQFKTMVQSNVIKVPLSMRGTPKPLGLFNSNPKKMLKNIETRTFEDEFAKDNKLIQEELQFFKDLVDSELKDALDAVRAEIFPNGSHKTDIHRAAWRLMKRCGLVIGQVNQIGEDAKKLGLTAEEIELYNANKRKTIRSVNDMFLDDAVAITGTYANQRRYMETMGYHMFEYMLHTGHTSYFTEDRWFDLLCAGVIRRHAGSLGALRFKWLWIGDKDKWYLEALSNLTDEAAWSEVKHESFDEHENCRQFLELRWCDHIAGRNEDGTTMTDAELADANRHIDHPGDREWVQHGQYTHPDTIRETSEFMARWFEEEWITRLEEEYDEIPR